MQQHPSVVVPKGIDGVDGESISIVETTTDANGNTVIEFSDGSTVTVAKGDQGEAGQDGADGLTPEIGENGNWWIGDTDTGITAEGQDGADGQDGTGDGISLGSSNSSSGNNISKCVTGPSNEIFALVAVLGLAGAVAAPMISQYSKVIGEQISAALQPFQLSGPNQPAWLVQVNRNLAQVGTSANELAAPIVIGAGILAALGTVGAACGDSNGGSSK